MLQILVVHHFPPKTPPTPPTIQTTTPQKSKSKTSSPPCQIQTITIPSSSWQKDNPKTLVVALPDQATIPTPNLNDSPFNQGDNEPFQDTFEDSLYDSLALIDEIFKDLMDAALALVGSPNK